MNNPVQYSNPETQTIASYEKYKADIFLMSPPCQPFTRQGKQEGKDDMRCKSFMFILDMIVKMEVGGSPQKVAHQVAPPILYPD